MSYSREIDQSGPDAELLKEIRDRFRYFSDAWREAREQSQIDRRYALGDPWDPKDRRAREDAGRPCISHDEISQYLNAAINNVRQSRKGIKILPAGFGASEKTAEFREDHIRSIEKSSHAQQAYIAAFENMLRGSYGAFRITRRYVSNRIDAEPQASLFDQEIVIKAIPNPDAVLYDPDCTEPDWSDGRACFVLDPTVSKDEFKRKYPRAKVQDFSADDVMAAPDWISAESVLVAEYWRVETDFRTVYLLEDGTVTFTLPRGAKPEKQRKVEQRKIVQYVTNGIEILERNEQPGDTIPIVFLTGPRVYLEEGSKTKWKVGSLIRLARDPQMTLAFLCSQEAEEAGLSPKAPFVGYKGQFESAREAWEACTKVPQAFLEVDAVIDGMAPGQPLPLPTRPQFEPHFQQYEIAKDSARRAIQAAMGITPLPTAAQRDNEKSGIALQRIQNQQALGSYHFVDNYDRALEVAGRIIDSWIPVVYDTERDLGLHRADESYEMARLNTPEPYLDQKGELQHYPVEDADHDVTISTDRSADSQREEASDFLDNLIANLGKLPLAPPQMAHLLALAIKMKQLGPLGDQMAEIIAPDNQGQLANAQQAIGQAQQQLQAQNLLLQELQQELGKLKLERAGKVIDNEYKVQLEKMRFEVQLAQAEITTKAQQLSERLEFVEDLWKQLHTQAHESAMQAVDHSQEQSLADQAQAAAQQQAQPAATESTQQ